MSTIYQIQLQSYLDQRWADWFDPLRIEYQPNGQTWLTGPLRDQAELHGINSCVREGYVTTHTLPVCAVTLFVTVGY
ncbi:MAG: hypothetical protein R2867_09075 [Caldilineaceae bacterium]